MTAKELSVILSILGDRKVIFYNGDRHFTINSVKITQYQVSLSDC